MLRKYSIICLVIFIAFSKATFSQTDFKNSYDQWTLSCQRELSNSDYLLLFREKISRTDNLGTPIWSKEFIEGGLSLNADFRLRCTQQTTDGGFIMTGSYSEAGTNDVVLIKTDNLGVVTWSKSYGGLGDDNGIWVEQTADGGYAIAGSKDVPPGPFGPGVFTEGDIYIIKTDNVGTVQWENALAIPGVGSAQNIKQTSDGGYIVTGNTAPEDQIGNLYLIKLNNLGIITWQLQYNLSCNAGIASSGREVWEIPGGYIVGGYVGGEVPGFKSKAVILKVDAIGDVLDIGAFEYTLGGGGMTDLGFSSMDVLASGEFIGCGGGYNDFGPLYLLKMDANLDMVWCRTYFSFSFASATSIRENNDLGFSLIDGTSQLLKTTDQGMIHCEVPNSVFQAVAIGDPVNLPTIAQPPGVTSVLNIL